MSALVDLTAQGIGIDSNGDYVWPSELPQMHINRNYRLYFFDANAAIVDLSYYGATIIGLFIISLAVEMMQFIKWYMISRKRITSNCLNSLIDLHKDRETVKKEQRKIRLNMCERVVVTILHFIIKALNLLIIVLIMATYNIGYIMIASAGFMMGNLIFGLIKDSIVIKRIKQERKDLLKRRQQMNELLKKKTNLVDEKTMDAL